MPGLNDRYEVSDMGHVRSLRHGGSLTPKRIKPLVMREFVTHNGYKRVGLTVNGVQSIRFVHRIAYEAFIKECPHGYQIAHLNGVRDDNRLCNLKLVTPSENESHKIIHGTNQKGDKHYSRRNPEKMARGQKHGRYTHPERNRKKGLILNAVIVSEMRCLFRNGISQIDIAKKYKISRSYICHIINYKSWKHVV